MEKNKYIKSFVFGFKSLFLLVLLVVPIAIFFLLGGIPKDILEKTSLYVKPLIVSGLWQAKDMQKLSTDQEGNEVYEFRLESGQKTTIEKKREEAIYTLEDNLFVKTNRQANGDLEMTGIKGKVFSRLENDAFGPEMRKYMVRPAGYYADIIVKLGRFTLTGRIVKGALVLFIAVFCLALYFPIIKAIVNLFKSK